MGQRVQRVRTSVSEQDMTQAIIESWKEMFGESPTKEQVSLVLAQNALETGNRKSMWNYNIGNITTDGKGSYDYIDDLETNEQVKPGQWKKMNLKYRAYPSLKDGAKDYLKLLSGKRYGNAWEHIKNPDPKAFSKALKQSGYYTANEDPYTKSIAKLYDKFNKSNSYEVAKNMPTTVNDPSDIMETLNKFIDEVIASERNNKQLYKKYLPTNDINIKVFANYTDSIEFSRILCLALNEELLADAFTHTDNDNVEIQCSIQGPKDDCMDAVIAVTQSVTDMFKMATKNIGGINVVSNIAIDTKTQYKPITITAALNEYNKFLLKII